MADSKKQPNAWDESERDRLRMSLAATAAQRLAWLEEAMWIASMHARITPDEIARQRRKRPDDSRNYSGTEER